jgi:hypothetical protein
MAKGTVEHYSTISIRDWRRHGVLREGTRDWCWVDGQMNRNISVEAQQIRVILRYQARDVHGKLEAIEDQIPLDATDVGCGRQRYWFWCPDCGKRASILYFAKYFRCRMCHRRHGIQSTTPSGPPLERIRKNRVMLGGSRSLVAPFPPRPRYMRLEKYRRMMEEDQKAVSQFLAETATSFAADSLAAQSAEPKLRANQAG